MVILASIVLAIAYIAIGFLTSACFTWCFGMPNPRGWEEELKAIGIQLMLIFLWPFFLLYVLYVWFF